MAKNKDPAVLFYPEAYLVGTRFMTFEQKGKYMDLLCFQHQQGHLSEDDMLAICGEYDPRVFDKFEQDENGLYFNPRMDEEKERRAKYTAAMRANGVRGGRPRQNQSDNQQVNQLDNQSGNLLRNRNINRNKDIDIDNKEIESEEEKKKKKEEKKSQTDIYIERFERFWRVYPKKIGKGDARKAFVKHQPSEKLTETMIKAIETAKKSVQWTKDGGKYIPNPSTWLNQERWEDELTAAPDVAQEQKSEVDKWFEEVYMEGAFKR